MDGGYSWNDSRDGSTYRLPGPEHIGWWAAAALVASLLLHVVVFFMLDRVLDGLGIGQGLAEVKELTTAPMNVEQVVVEAEPQPETPAPPPDEAVIPPTDTTSLLEEIDLLAKLPKDEEIDIKPDVLAPEYALKMAHPTPDGEPAAVTPEMASAFDIDADLPELGRMEERLPPAAEGQITVDPGAVPPDDPDLKKFTDKMLREGAKGKVRGGALEGLTSLDDLLGLPANMLVGKKTMLPSDLLFEFNSAELRESARVGLMKLGLLIDRNPGLFCWVEGHTDLIGSEEDNLDLSRRRAESVRNYLVKSMRMDGTKIITGGLGETQPLVPGGDKDAQALNRRVEIRMRKEAPPAAKLRPASRPAPRAIPIPVETPPAPVRPPKPAATPPRALPLDAPPATPPPAPPLALPIEEPPAPPLALPVEGGAVPRPAPPRAVVDDELDDE